MRTYRVVVRVASLRLCTPERRTFEVEALDPVSAEWIVQADLDRMGERALGRLHAVQIGGLS